MTSVKGLEFPQLVEVNIERCAGLCEVRLWAPALNVLSITDCHKLSVLDVHSPNLDRLNITGCTNMQEAELAAFTRACGSRSLAYVNVDLFGLEPNLAQMIFGGHMISSILSEGGEEYWSCAKRIASIAEDEPAMTKSVLYVTIQSDATCVCVYVYKCMSVQHIDYSEHGRHFKIGLSCVGFFVCLNMFPVICCQCSHIRGLFLQ